MGKEIECPICGSTEVKIIDEESKKYRCLSCGETFVPRTCKNILGVNVDCTKVANQRKTFFETLMRKVVEIRAYFNDKISAGSAFFISKEYLLTNAHVVFRDIHESTLINQADKIVGKNYDQTKEYEFEIISADLVKDIAIIKVEDAESEFSVLCDEVYSGEKVYTIGNSRGQGLCVLEGIISDTDRVIHGQHYLMTSVLITKGNSGGPVFNEDGLIVGMVTLASSQSLAMNYAVPSSELIDYINEIENKEELEIL